jgi:simple sugar transport system permease protein
MTAATAGTTSRRVSFAGLRELVLLPVIVLVVVLGSVLTPNFLTANNIFNNVLVSSAVLGMVVIAESLILISGYFDLSLESVVGLAPAFAVWLTLPAVAGGLGLQLPPILAILLMFVLSIAIGLFNGFLIAKLRLNAFMVTLAMLILLRGLVLGISGGRTFSGLPAEFRWLGSTFIAGISVQVWILVVAFALAALFMRRHPTGRRIYALGGNEDAALAAGVNTRRLTIGLFVAGAMIAAFAGLMLTSRIASVTASQGDGMIFTVFAAAVIGGISLNGGKGTILGALTGVILLGLIQNILTLTNVPSFWIDAIYGLIILAALIFGVVSERMRKVRRGV